MAVIAPNPSGWYPDPGGRHEHRFWNGKAWTDHVSDNGLIRTSPLANDQRANLRWYEPLLYVVILLLWIGVTAGVATVVNDHALDGKVAVTQEQADQYRSDAQNQAAIAAAVTALVAMAFIAPRVGYRIRDTFMLLIPIWGLVILLKLLWRLACSSRHYWAAAPGGIH